MTDKTKRTSIILLRWILKKFHTRRILCFPTPSYMQSVAVTGKTWTFIMNCIRYTGYIIFIYDVCVVCSFVRAIPSSRAGALAVVTAISCSTCIYSSCRTPEMPSYIRQWNIGWLATTAKNETAAHIFCTHIQNLGPNPMNKEMWKGRFQPQHLGNT